MELRLFITYIDQFSKLKPSAKIDWFIYYQIEVQKNDGVKARDISNCFEELDFVKYKDISRYLNSNSINGRNKIQKFIRKDQGVFKLNARYREILAKEVNLERPRLIVNRSLQELSKKISKSEENEFYTELVKCFEVGAKRAAIVMTWNLTISHLFEYILNNELSKFESVLKTNTDKRIKLKAITKKDDFSEIPEGKFIEFCRQSKIISNDVRKILEYSLGVRNTYAHPSNVTIKESKVISYIEDLVVNVIEKYKI